MFGLSPDGAPVSGAGEWNAPDRADPHTPGDCAYRPPVEHPNAGMPRQCNPRDRAPTSRSESHAPPERPPKSSPRPARRWSAIRRDDRSTPPACLPRFRRTPRSRHRLPVPPDQPSRPDRLLGAPVTSHSLVCRTAARPRAAVAKATRIARPEQPPPAAAPACTAGRPLRRGLSRPDSRRAVAVHRRDSSGVSAGWEAGPAGPVPATATRRSRFAARCPPNPCHRRAWLP